MSTPLGLVLGFWMGGGNRGLAKGSTFLRSTGQATASFLANTPGVLSAVGSADAEFTGDSSSGGGGSSPTYYILGF
jgi:hypothetical protein